MALPLPTESATPEKKNTKKYIFHKRHHSLLRYNMKSETFIFFHFLFSVVWLNIFSLANHFKANDIIFYFFRDDRFTIWAICCCGCCCHSHRIWCEWANVFVPIYYGMKMIGGRLLYLVCCCFGTIATFASSCQYGRKWCCAYAHLFLHTCKWLKLKQ